MRVPELGGNVEAEVVRPVQLFVAQSNNLAVSLFDDGFREDRLDRWIQLLEYILSRLRERDHGQQRRKGRPHAIVVSRHWDLFYMSAALGQGNHGPGVPRVHDCSVPTSAFSPCAKHRRA